MAGDPSFRLDPCLPDDLDVVHFHTPVAGRLDLPHITTIHGNGEPGSFGPAHVFVARDHMRRMQGRHCVYNGIDPDDYVYRKEKDDHLLFLGLASRRVKGVDRAIRIAKLGDRRLLIAGGRGLSLDRRIRGGGRGGQCSSAAPLCSPLRWGQCPSW